jgi:alkylation response protein AidB-like acyl-CoA dehydrogenase
MRDVPRVQAELAAAAEMRYCASRAYSYAAVEGMWQALLDDRPLGDDVRVDMLRSRVEGTPMAREVTQWMVQLVGTKAIFTSCVLDQLVRDAITIGQHVSVGPMMIETAGALLFGFPPSGPLAAIV